MVRISKIQQRRAVSPRRRLAPSIKTGSLKDNLLKGYKEHANTVNKSYAVEAYIPKVKEL
jgi:hypothetical protein